MGRRPLLAFVLLVLLFPTFGAGAEQPSFDEEFSLEWSHDFGDVYITTAPLFVENQLYVRTSASWGGTDVPSVTAFDPDGQLLWSHANPNSSHHDMAPLLHIEQGAGACGTWPNMLLVAWSDGRVEARSPENGELYWSHQSQAITWGITGSMALDGDLVVVPTRTGVVALCASDGEATMEATTGLGWRNGVTVTSDGYYLGDENGTLWVVERNGTVRSEFLETGKIRHAPLITTAGLFVQVQKGASSTAHLVQTPTLTSTSSLDLGASPAMPIHAGDYLLSADSDAVHLIECRATCIEINRSSFLSNGEIGQVHHGQFMLPYNGPDLGWGIVNVSSEGKLLLETVMTGADGYATSGPAFVSTGDAIHLAFGSDEGIVYFYTSMQDDSSQLEQITNSNFDWAAQGMVFLLYVSIGGAAIQMLRNKGASMLKFVSLYVLLIALLVLDQVAVQWSQFIEEVDPSPEQEVWDSSWEESWRDTQIVSIVIDGEMHAVGGLEGYSNALELTIAACEELGLEPQTERTEMGTYLVAFNGVTGEGWEYTIDGRLAPVAADYSNIDSTSRVQWYTVDTR
jgi:hypothetical protein